MSQQRINFNDKARRKMSSDHSSDEEGGALLNPEQGLWEQELQDSGRLRMPPRITLAPQPSGGVSGRSSPENVTVTQTTAVTNTPRVPSQRLGPSWAISAAEAEQRAAQARQAVAWKVPDHLRPSVVQVTRATVSESLKHVAKRLTKRGQKKNTLPAPGDDQAIEDGWATDGSVTDIDEWEHLEDDTLQLPSEPRRAAQPGEEGMSQRIAEQLAVGGAKVVQIARKRQGCY